MFLLLFLFSVLAYCDGFLFFFSFVVFFRFHGNPCTITLLTGHFTMAQSAQRLCILDYLNELLVLY